MLMKLAPKRPRSMRKFYFSIGATLVILLLGRYFSLMAQERRAVQQAQFVEDLLQMNSLLPRQVDAVTTLKKIELIYGDTFVYRYRVDLASSSLPWECRAKMQDRAQVKLEALACKEPKVLDAMRRFGFRQWHQYVGDDDGTLFYIDLYPAKLNCST
jgi:hypothetical protein